MAETVNIATMADRLANEIFGVFNWKRIGPTNTNWACINPQHQKSTHPSDIVFFYDNPYRNDRTFVNCDLKSYAAATIDRHRIHKAAKDLAIAVSCAEQSAEWQGRFTQPTSSPVISGLLFIYNHDGSYDEDFQRNIRDTLSPEALGLPKGAKLAIFGPADIHWLHNVADDILRMRGKKAIPEQCRYYYPNLVRSVNKQPTKAFAATIEMLTGPWITLEYETTIAPHHIGYVIYCRHQGRRVEEFQYLFDHLLHYNILENNIPVTIKLFTTEPEAPSRFDIAKVQYIDDQNGGADFKDLLDSIKCETMTTIAAKFSDIAIGMRDEG